MKFSFSWLATYLPGPAPDPKALGDHIDRLYRAAWSLCGSRDDAQDLVRQMETGAVGGS